jgi:D-beta-D-heptose 7-phosphate kinase/D-beta-D-heptose 1-phosphate adenosyltransferase
MVIGDAMLDVKWDCKSTRISPEAPVPVCLFNKDEYSLGGAANVAAQIARDQQCVFIYLDEERHIAPDLALKETQLSLMLREQNIVDRGLFGCPDYIIPTKIRVWAGQQVCRLDKELEPHEINVDDLMRDQWIEAIGHLLTEWNVRLVILSDYNKGTLDDDFIQSVVDLCNARGVLTILDPKRPTYRSIKGLTIVTPNQAEMEKTILEPNELSEQLEDTFLLHTKGAAGMDLYQRGELLQHQEAHTVEVADTCGAGDTVISFLALSLARSGYKADGLGMYHAMRHANYAASRTVRHRGSYVLTADEITGVFGLPFTR